jgi:hypothetical protein
LKINVGIFVHHLIIKAAYVVTIFILNEGLFELTEFFFSLVNIGNIANHTLSQVIIEVNRISPACVLELKNVIIEDPLCNKLQLLLIHLFIINLCIKILGYFI